MKLVSYFYKFGTLIKSDLPIAEYILNFPEKLGLTVEEISEIFNKYSEDVDVSENTMQEIAVMLIDMGWTAKTKDKTMHDDNWVSMLGRMAKMNKDKDVADEVIKNAYLKQYKQG
jgi:hypothetical protein